MVRCFYCMDENHEASGCKLSQDAGLDYTRKRRIKRWGYTPAEKLLADLAQQVFVPKHLSWLLYFFRYSNIEKIFKAESQPELLSGVKDIYSDLKLIEAEQLFRMGQEKFKEGASQEATVILNLVLEKNPKDYRAQLTKGYVHIERSELDQALKSFSLAAGGAPSDYYRSLARMLMSRVNQCTGQIEQAIISAQKAVCSRLTEANYLLSLLYVEKGLTEDGLAHLRLAIEEDREYIIACCHESGFAEIEPELNFFLDNSIKEEKKKADYQLEEVRVTFQEAENLDAKVYDPLDLKNARFKYFVAEKKHKTRSYFGYTDANRLGKEAIAYLKTAKYSSVARKKIATHELKEYVKFSLSKGIYYGICLAGWGFVIAGGLRIALCLTFGREMDYKIFVWAFNGAIIGFLWAYILNWRVTHYGQRYFLKRFTKRYQKQRGEQPEAK